jgi:hypothetical protein
MPGIASFTGSPEGLSKKFNVGFGARAPLSLLSTTCVILQAHACVCDWGLHFHATVFIVAAWTRCVAGLCRWRLRLNCTPL